MGPERVRELLTIPSWAKMPVPSEEGSTAYEVAFIGPAKCRVWENANGIWWECEIYDGLNPPEKADSIEDAKRAAFARAVQYLSVYDQRGRECGKVIAALRKLGLIDKKGGLTP